MGRPNAFATGQPATAPAPRALVIVGAGGHGRETLDIIEAINAATAIPATHPTHPGLIHFVGFFDDGVPDALLLARRNVETVGTVADLAERDEEFVIAVGDPATRRVIAATLARPAASALVHPESTLGSDIELGDGVLIAARAALTTNVRLGAHTHCNPGVVVSHDCRVGDFVSLSPGVILNGNVSIGDDVLVGAGAVLLPGVTVGDRATIGAGAVVVDDVDPDTTVVGNPARLLPRR
ncbi:MAG: acetyltransferase [Acidimicrobiales bacterium]|nr:acetyltransferase [Acidimicrobiales bacterium]